MSTITIFAALAAATAGASALPHPISLHADVSSGFVDLQVVGDSAVPLRAAYALEVSGGAAGSNNRSVQRGNAALAAGQTVTLARLRLNLPKGGGYSAKLQVTPASGETYEEVWRSPE